MSAERQAAIASIDAQLLQNQLAKAQGQYGPLDVVRDPVSGKVVSSEEGVARQDILKQQEQEEKRIEEEGNLLEKARLQAKRRQIQAVTSTQNALRNAGNKSRDVGRFIAGIPTPGDVWVPFFILLALFLIFIPINGHTRMYWFWLVITNSARISYNGMISTITNSNSGPENTTGVPQSTNQNISGQSSGTSVFGTNPIPTISYSTVSNYLDYISGSI